MNTRCGNATRCCDETPLLLQGSILNFGVIFPVLRGHFYHIRYQYAVLSIHHRPLRVMTPASMRSHDLTPTPRCVLLQSWTTLRKSNQMADSAVLSTAAVLYYR
jgi:hypothetical protein